MIYEMAQRPRPSGVLVFVLSRRFLPVRRKVMRQNQIIVHEPPTARGTIEECGYEHCTHACDHRRSHTRNHTEEVQEQNRHQKPHQGNPIIERHGAQKTAFIAFQLQSATRTCPVQLKPRARFEQRVFSAIRTAMTQSSRNNLASGDLHDAPIKKTLSPGGKRLSRQSRIQSVSSDQEPSW